MTMTREEAITIIDNLHLIGSGRNQHENDLKINIALDMAIEALSAKPSGDLISRQDAIDAIAKFVPYVIDDISTESYTNGLRDAYNLIYQLPSVDRPTGEWIWSDEDASWKCGRCDCVFEEIDWKPDYNFCPNCGADMRGENK